MRLGGPFDISARTVRTSGIDTGEPVSLAAKATTARTGDGIGVATILTSAERVPAFDTERVAQIRKAIAEDRYPLVPAKIADALIAAKLYGIVQP